MAAMTRVFRKLDTAQEWVRLLVHNRLSLVGLILTGIYIILAVFGPLLVTKDPNAIAGADRLLAPSMGHPFGTDGYGRDIFARTIYGARYSLIVATLVVISSSFAGVTVGTLVGYYRGWIDETVMRGVDVLFAFPSILLALIIIAILGPGLDKAIVALAIAYTPIMIRITRGAALSAREEEYIMAARLYGESDRNIMFREMGPNIMAPVLVQASITFAFSILSEAGLSYLGLSARPPTSTWGVMISEGQEVITLAPWASIFPGIGIMTAVLGLTFLGMGVREIVDPKGEVSIKESI